MLKKQLQVFITACLLAVALSGCGKKVSEAELDAVRTEAAEDASAEDAEEQAGTFRIQETGIDIPFVTADTPSGGTATEGRAVCFPYGSQRVIGGKGDGFSKLRDIRENETRAEIEWEDGALVSYVCTKTEEGTNKGSALLDGTGTDIRDMNPDGLTVYVYGDGNNVFLTFWQEAKP